MVFSFCPAFIVGLLSSGRMAPLKLPGRVQLSPSLASTPWLDPPTLGTLVAGLCESLDDGTIPIRAKLVFWLLMG